MSRVNIVKRIKIDGLWKMFSIPRNAKGNYDWNAIADGRYYVEWYVGGKRRCLSAGVTAAQALDVKRRKRHELRHRRGIGPEAGGSGQEISTFNFHLEVEPSTGGTAPLPCHPFAPS